MEAGPRPDRDAYSKHSRGDLVWLRFQPQTGRERSGRRPALILSPKKYNAKAGLALCCPITSRVKGYSFEVGLADVPGANAEGAVLVDRIKSLDWRARNARKIGSAPPDVLADVTAKLLALVDPT